MNSPHSTEQTIKDNAQSLRRLRPLYESLAFPWEEEKAAPKELSPREQWEAMTGKKLDDPHTTAELDALIARMEAATQRSPTRG